MERSILTFVEDVYEDLELWYPLLRLQEAGYTTRLAAPELRTYAGKHGYPLPATCSWTRPAAMITADC